MTSEIVERLTRRAHSMASGTLFNPDGPEAAAEITRLRTALAAAEAREAAKDEATIADLDSRMKAAGMIPLSDLLAGNTPMEKWMAHTGVRDLDTFEQWLTMRHREFMTMRAGYELGDSDKSDELYEWVMAHSAAFGEVAANFRAMKERSALTTDRTALDSLLAEERRKALEEAIALAKRVGCLSVEDIQTLILKDKQEAQK